MELWAFINMVRTSIDNKFSNDLYSTILEPGLCLNVQADMHPV